jgi:hypothetical protein
MARFHCFSWTRNVVTARVLGECDQPGLDVPFPARAAAKTMKRASSNAKIRFPSLWGAISARAGGST